MAAPLTPRNLIDVGVFAVLYLVVQFGIGVFGYLGPALMFVTVALAILANGIVFQLYLTRARPGMVLALAAVLGVVMLLTGHAWTVLATTVAAGLLAEAVLHAGPPRETPAAWRGVLAYGVFTLGYAGTMLPVLYQRDTYRDSLVAGGVSPDYADTVVAAVTGWLFLVALAVGFAIALLGGLWGRRTLHRHFARAGVA